MMRSVNRRYEAPMCAAIGSVDRDPAKQKVPAWGKNDPFFTVEGAKAYKRDLPNAELHLIDTGHCALEDSSTFIAERMRKFLS